MSLSSVCVVTNALRLRGFKPKFAEGRQDAGPAEGIEPAAVTQPAAERTEKAADAVVQAGGMSCGHCTSAVEEGAVGGRRRGKRGWRSCKGRRCASGWQSRYPIKRCWRRYEAPGTRRCP